MPRKSKKKIIENLDHAFELTLILITILSGTIAQFVADEQEVNLPPIIANMQRLSIVFIVPSILTILAWIAIYFIDDENWKMGLKTYAWSSIILLMIIEVIELFAVCRPPSYPEWINHFATAIIFVSLFLPLIPLWLIIQVLNRYKTVLKDIDFFTREGKVGKIKRYGPFVLALTVFWITYFATTSV